MSKKNYQEALNKIKNEYDAYYLGNRYGKNFDCNLK